MPEPGGPDVGVAAAQPSFRRYREGDEEGMLAVLRAAFPRWPTVDTAVAPIEHLRWKMRSDRMAPRFHGVGEGDGRIIASSVIIVQRWRVQDRVLLSCEWVDFALHPDYQGRGIMKPFWDWRLDRFLRAFDLTVWVSGNRSVLDYGLTKERIAPLGNPVQLLQLDEDSSPLTVPRSPWRLATVTSFDGRVDALWEEAARPFQFALHRSRDYLNWRFAHPCAGCFVIRTADQDGRLLGYAVLATRAGRGFIADLVTLPDRPDVVDSLLADARQHFRTLQVEPVRCWCPERHPYRDLLLRHGFRPKRVIEGLTVRDYRRAGLEFLSEPDVAVHIMAGDMDVV